MIVFGARLALGSALELLSPTTELVVTGSDIKSLSWHVIIQSRDGLLLCIEWEKMTLQINDFLIFSYLMRHPLLKVCHLSSLLQMLKNCGMVDDVFFGSFLCSCKRISFDDAFQLFDINFWWPDTTLLIFKSLISFLKLLELSLCCTFISSSWAKCVADVVSHLCCFTTQVAQW